MRSMIILAGGKGERLKPITPTYHKSLIPIEGVPNVQRTVETFSSRVDKFFIVICSEDYERFKFLEGKNVKLVKNSEGSCTNTITSMILGLREVVKVNSDEVLVTEGDTFLRVNSLRISKLGSRDSSYFFLSKRENEWKVNFDSNTFSATSLEINSSGDCLSGLCRIRKKDIIQLLTDLEVKALINGDKSVYWEEVLFDKLSSYDFKVIVSLTSYSDEYDTPEDLVNLIGEVEYNKLLNEVKNES